MLVGVAVGVASSGIKIVGSAGHGVGELVGWGELDD